MANINLQDQIDFEARRIRYPEQTLGKGLNQPNASENSGSRKILHSTQYDQVLTIMHPEVPLIGTGYEDQFGMNSSSFKTAENNYEVLRKIYKFSFSKEHYFMIVRNIDTNEIDVIERKCYYHNTESYGYINNCEYIDSLCENMHIDKGMVYLKSTLNDQYNNRQDGVNLITAYMACDKTKEDGIILSAPAAKKLASPLIKKVQIVINDNDIPLNLYGDENAYKIIPDIGEYIKDNELCAIRREKKEESLYTLSYHMLRKTLMSDDIYTECGRVIDLDIYCNNIEKLETSASYCGQFNNYYQEAKRFADELTRFVGNYIKLGHKLTYKLQKLYSNSLKMLNGEQYIKEGKVFSNIIIEMIVIDEFPMNVGDKVTDRYGGKGVISEIRPEHLMPQLDNGQYVEIIYGQTTCVNRENPGQLDEVSINFCSARISEYINTKVFDAAEFVKMYLDFIRILSPEQAAFTERMISGQSDEEMMWYLNDLVESGIYISTQPISEAVDIDKIAKIHEEFPFIKPYVITIPIIDSNGNVRYTQSKRTMPCGKKYIYRLKQHADDKFSVTSLSSTNIRNENSRNRLSKDHKAPYSKTPIRFGEMETGNFGHMGMEMAIINLMIYAVSPTARRSCQEMLTGDPFNIDIKLTEDASNISVEIFNAYFKAMGYALIFEKKRKVPKYHIDYCPILELPPIPSIFCNYNPIIEFKQDQTYYADHELIKLGLEYIQNKFKTPIEYYPILELPPLMEDKNNE